MSLFGRRRAAPAITARAVHVSTGEGFTLSVVGESHRQDGIREAIGISRGGVDVVTRALLRAEPENPHDPNAVMVLLQKDGGIEWCHCGYLSRDDAPEFADALEQLADGLVVTCDARVVGAGPDAPHKNIGVILDMPYPDDWPWA